MEYIGNVSLESIHIGSLQAFIDARRRQGIKTRTINHGLKIVRRICNLESLNYSSAELQNIYEIANKVCEERRSGVILTLLRNPSRNIASGNKQDVKSVSL